MYRDHTCGQLRKEDAGKKVTLAGWVSKRRNLGSIVFIDLRDREGYVQVCVKTDEIKVPEIRNEYILEVTGVVTKKDVPNKNLATGEIEVVATNIKVINTANQPPISTQEETDANEDIRLKYRYLDLRRLCMQKRLRIRAKIVRSIHEYLDSKDFIEIETPYLSPSTPEGARDYLVPSRVHKGCFYALPQSPQLFKQMLMVSGFERYYQIARCFRDEDLRADRQPEFTQIDCEMSFVDEEDVMGIMEKMLQEIFKEVLDVDIQLPIQRMTYKEAMDRFGSDKPDTRFGLEFVNISDIVKDCGFGVFANAASDEKGSVRGINVKGGAEAFSKKGMKKLEEHAKLYKAKGLAWIKVTEEGIESPIAKFFSEEEMNAILTKMEATAGDLLLFIADKNAVVYDALGQLRLEVARKLDLMDKNKYNLLWVTEFPLFEKDEETGRMIAMHHPFTSPLDEDVEGLTAEDKTNLRAKAYDIVLNGYELGGGSVRISNADVQKKMFDAIGISDEEANDKFGYLLEAFKYGVPPHAGLAFGFDRLMMLLTGADNIREVIAFPKNQNAICPMTNAPGVADNDQLDELNIKLDVHDAE